MRLAIYTSAIASLAFLTLDTHVLAQQEQRLGFGISGAARVFYEPDAYDISFGVVTEDPDIQKCKAQHMAILQKTSDFLAQNKERVFSLKQEGTKLEAQGPNSPGLEPPPGNEKRKIYRFTTNYVARVKEPKALASFQEGLITSGVTDIYTLDLFSEKLPEFIDQARKQAIADAKHKAELAAAELNWKLLGARSIEFRESEWPWMTEQRASVAVAHRAYTYDRSNRPELTNYVSSSVSITFEYEPKNADTK